MRDIASHAVWSEEEKRMIVIINRFRTTNNMPELCKSDIMKDAAEMQSSYMQSLQKVTNKGYRSETRNIWDRLKLLGFSGYSGENVARTKNNDPQEAFEKWANNKIHRKNILEGFNMIGVSVKPSLGEEGTWFYWTVVFGRREQCGDKSAQDCKTDRAECKQDTEQTLVVKTCDPKTSVTSSKCYTEIVTTSVIYTTVYVVKDREKPKTVQKDPETCPEDKSQDTKCKASEAAENDVNSSNNLGKMSAVVNAFVMKSESLLQKEKIPDLPSENLISEPEGMAANTKSTYIFEPSFPRSSHILEGLQNEEITVLFKKSLTHPEVMGQFPMLSGYLRPFLS